MAAVPFRGNAAAANLGPSAPAALTTHELYERYGQQIFRFCQRQLRNREEAEDATQTTFLNAFRGLERGSAVEFESAWLYKIALNVCMSRQRSSQRRGRLELVGDLDAMHDRLPARDEGEHDELFGLDVALRRLPEQQRRALLLREWQGLTYHEIAEALGLSQPAVETLLFRARQSLAQGLNAPAEERRGRGRPRGSRSAPRALATLRTSVE